MRTAIQLCLILGGSWGLLGCSSPESGSGGSEDTTSAAETTAGGAASTNDDETTGGVEPTGGTDTTEPVEDGFMPPYAAFASFDAPVGAGQGTVYHPEPPVPMGDPGFPAVVLLQGANVPRAQYAAVAGEVARWGFVVVVPDRQRDLFGMPGLWAEFSGITDALATAEAQGQPDAPLAGLVDTERFGLIGHSFGGAAALLALQDGCGIPFCMGTWTTPASLRAVAGYGANLSPSGGGDIPPTDNRGVAVMLVQGSQDGVALPEEGLATYAALQEPPIAYVLLDGANHYGVCDENNPAGPAPDASEPTIAQADATRTIGAWMGLFMRAEVLEDAAAGEVVYNTGDAADPNVMVMTKL